MEYRKIIESELDRKLFSGFIRLQNVDLCYRREGENWVIKSAPFTDDWDEKDYVELIASLKNTVRSDGAVFGAFCENELKGFASVESCLFGSVKQYLDLSNLHVSKDMRRKGIGRRLFEYSCVWAREHGAKKLYISAHSALESQNFYRALGCREASEYSDSHVKKEPYDCQMEYVL